MIGSISGGAIYFNLLINRYDVLNRNSYLPSLMYVLLSSALVPVLQLHPLHFANLLLLRLMSSVFSFFKKERAARQLFNSGFLVSVIALLYLPTLPLLLFLLLALVLMRSFQLREWLIVLVGMILPFFYLAAWWFPDTLFSEWSSLRVYVQQYTLPGWVKFPVSVYWLAGYLLLLLLLSLLRLRSQYYKNIVRTRMYQQAILLLLLFAAGLPYLMGTCRPANFLLLVIPMATIVAHYFISSRRRGWLYEFMLWALFGLIVWNNTTL